MNKSIKSALQIAFSLALGIFLIWFIYKDLTEEDKQNIVNSFEIANYWWIALSALLSVFSHMARAHRWKYTLETIDIRTPFWSRFFAVMIGYIANLAFPRLGEVTRCGALARYENASFEKSFGTVIAERIVDLVVLMALTVAAVLYQLDTLRDLLLKLIDPIVSKASGAIWLAAAGIVMLAGGWLLWRLFLYSENKAIVAVREKIRGFGHGINTLRTMPNQAQFYFHTFLIWGMYLGMFLVTFYCLPATSDVPFGGQLAAFVLGGISIVAVQGGLGAYPLAIMWILSLYGVPENEGYAFGWIVWAAQTIMIMLLGFIAMIGLPLVSSKKAAYA